MSPLYILLFWKVEVKFLVLSATLIQDKKGFFLFLTGENI